MQKSFISVVLTMLLSFTFLPSSILAAVGEGEGSVDSDISTEDANGDSNVDADADVNTNATENAEGETNVEANANAESEGNNDSQAITVNKLEVTSSKSEVSVGENLKINVQGWDENGNIIENLNDVQYSVDNESVATVNNNGELIPKASGTVTVTVTAGDVSKNLTFNVSAKGDENSELDGDVNSSLELMAERKELQVDETLQLSWDGLKEYEDVSFELSDNSKATINSNGELVAKSPGELTVWLKTDDGRETKLNLVIHPKTQVETELNSVEIDAPKATINLNETLPLDVDGFDVDGSKVEQVSNVTLSVDDESKATIDAKGHLHAKEEGEVTVTANVNGKTDTFEVQIDDNTIDGINLRAPKSTITVNEKLNLKVKGTDGESNNLANLKDVEFEVTDNSVATIDSEGHLVPKTAGTVKVLATADNSQDSLTVTIKEDANLNQDDQTQVDLDKLSDISLSAPKTNLNVNEQLKLSVKGLDKEGNDLGAMADVWFDVSNEDIAEVSANGYLIPKAKGSVTITANAEGETDTLQFTIDDSALSNISFETPEANVDLNENLKLKVNGEDENGVDLEDLHNVDFTVSDESVATVDSEGNVTPKEEGTVTVRAISDNYEDQMTLTVASNDNPTDTTEATNTGNSISGDTGNNSGLNGDTSENDWTSVSNLSTDSSNMNGTDSLTTPGVPSTGDGSSQSSMTWSWMALGLMAIAGTSFFAWRKQV